MSLIDYKNIDIYQGDSLILKDVDFHVDEGEFIYIIGTVGSGKSSLRKTFYCELDIYHEDGNEGEKAEVLGRDIITLKRRDIVACGPDNLDTPFPGLMIWLSAHEGRKERMVNIDDMIGITLDHIITDDLHVACQNDKCHPFLLQKFHLCSFHFGLVAVVFLD